MTEALTLNNWQDMAEKRKKQSFDPTDAVMEILERLKDFHGFKGDFINKCIEIAGDDALQKLSDEIASLKRGRGPSSEKKNK